MLACIAGRSTPNRATEPMLAPERFSTGWIDRIPSGGGYVAAQFVRCNAQFVPNRAAGEEHALSGCEKGD